MLKVLGHLRDKMKISIPILKHYRIKGTGTGVGNKCTEVSEKAGEVAYQERFLLLFREHLPVFNFPSAKECYLIVTVCRG